ncbi:hypothetical protein CHLRE_02g111400v5 [Chlamydomonas reinhardtii]|uniref:Uncharacterized protein n=1 Tax=Chlamydomonas reinhardtii TaxID=3055 RepID=A0A2K3E2Z6_CHLRE|nr:uncharacterized protein CHLRE_02g111400v5 [Chlamydomonas reinhardtii]PNW87161.1 hypothetical protein CHLRE_02g111400v5 [Chlamydomonas reinhardtii]
MPPITRDRGCLYYVPWLATFCVCLGVAGLGVWAYYTKQGQSKTLDALDSLDVTASNVGSLNSALLATAIVYLVIIVIIYLMSLWRSFIEAAHDATGQVAKGAFAFLLLAFAFELNWTLVNIWLTLLLMGNAIWASCVYILRGSITSTLEAIAKYGPATWLPSQGLPCPGQCLDLTTLVFINSDLQDACICDAAKLTSAQSAFNDTYDQLPGALSGAWVMWLAGVLLLINFGCQFSHTKRERELLERANTKVYNAF